MNGPGRLGFFFSMSLRRATKFSSSWLASISTCELIQTTVRFIFQRLQGFDYRENDWRNILVAWYRQIQWIHKLCNLCLHKYLINSRIKPLSEYIHDLQSQWELWWFRNPIPSRPSLLCIRHHRGISLLQLLRQDPRYLMKQIQTVIHQYLLRSQQRIRFEKIIQYFILPVIF